MSCVSWPPRVVTGSRYPVDRRRIVARYDATGRASRADCPTTICDCGRSRKLAPRSVFSDAGAGTTAGAASVPALATSCPPVSINVPARAATTIPRPRCERAASRHLKPVIAPPCLVPDPITAHP